MSAFQRAALRLGFGKTPQRGGREGPGDASLRHGHLAAGNTRAVAGRIDIDPAGSHLRGAYGDPTAELRIVGAASAAAGAVEIETGDYGEAAPPPATDPLGITGDQIEDLAASIAPVGSELQSDYEEIAEPEFDLNGLDVAPLGSDLDSAPKKPAPPPPDTSGITMADE